MKTDEHLKPLLSGLKEKPVTCPFKNSVDVVKLLCLLWELRSDVPANENAFQVHPLSLHQHPNLWAHNATVGTGASRCVEQFLPSTGQVHIRQKGSFPEGKGDGGSIARYFKIHGHTQKRKRTLHTSPGQGGSFQLSARVGGALRPRGTRADHTEACAALQPRTERSATLLPGTDPQELRAATQKQLHTDAQGSTAHKRWPSTNERQTEVVHPHSGL